MAGAMCMFVGRALEDNADVPAETGGAATVVEMIRP
jgi:hypothetical protein